MPAIDLKQLMQECIHMSLIVLHSTDIHPAPEELWSPCGSLLGSLGCCPGICQGYPDSDHLIEDAAPDKLLP